MILETLLQSADTMEVKGPVDIDVQGIAYDSRRVVPGGLFVAIRGHKADGAQFVADALSNGAAAVVSENDFEVGSGVTHIRVRCSRRALAALANAFYGDLSREMKVIGITGTNGKTTSAYMIRDLLRDGGFQPGLLGTVAYDTSNRILPAPRTTPEAPDIHDLFRQMREAGCDSVVMEASSHAIDQQRIHGITFAISVFTNLTRDHLDYHGNMESYFEVKARLFRIENPLAERACVINIDDPWGRKLVERQAELEQVLTYGFDEKAMVRASDIEIKIEGTCFTVSSPWGEARVRLNLQGRFNVSNALAAMAVGGLCGIRLPDMIKSLEAIQMIPGRLEAIPNRKNKRVFVDYAHTDDALRNVLAALRECCKGKLVVVFGCGGDRDRGKRRLMGQVAARLADFSVITSDNPRTEDPGAIIKDVIDGFEGSDAFEVILSRRDAIEKGLALTGRKDVLLVAGKGHETFQEQAGTIIPFDDRETVRELLG